MTTALSLKSIICVGERRVIAANSNLELQHRVTMCKLVGENPMMRQDQD